MDSKKKQTEEVRATPLKRESNSRNRSPYPDETLMICLDRMELVTDNYDINEIITKEQIAKTIGRDPTSLTLFYSSIVQYSIAESIKGKGYKVTNLFKRYKATDGKEKLDAIRVMFGNPPLYAEIISRYNFRPLPADDIFRSILVDEYKINENSVATALKVFRSNIDKLNYIERFTNTLAYPSHNIGTFKKGEEPDVWKEVNKDTLNISVPMSNGYEATIKFHKDYTIADINNIIAFLNIYVDIKSNQLETNIRRL